MLLLSTRKVLCAENNYLLFNSFLKVGGKFFLNIYDSLEEICPTEDRAVALGLFDVLYSFADPRIKRGIDTANGK